MLDEDLKLIADKCRADETKKMVNAIERTIKRQIIEPIEIALSHPTPGMWDTIFLIYEDAVRSSEETYSVKAKSYNCTAEENDVALTALRSRSWLSLRKKLEEGTSDTAVLSTLRESFEERFRYDESGVPRVWKPEDDLDSAFKKARDEVSSVSSSYTDSRLIRSIQTLALLPLFATISPTTTPLPPLPMPEPSYDTESDPTPFDPSTAYTLISSTKLLTLETRFKREADAAYVEAKRSMVSSVAQIPLWMYGVLVVLGWNEAMTVLFNPLYFAMLLILAASA